MGQFGQLIAKWGGGGMQFKHNSHHLLRANTKCTRARAKPAASVTCWKPHARLWDRLSYHPNATDKALQEYREEVPCLRLQSW